MRNRLLLITVLLGVVIIVARLKTLGFFAPEVVITINVVSKERPTDTVETAIRKSVGARHVSDYIDLSRQTVRFNWATQNLLDRSPSIALVIVSSTPEQKLRRMTIRQTWAKWCEEYNVKLVFYVGLPSDGDLRGIALESLFYDDLIIDEFQDGPYSASLKTLHMFRWFIDFYNGSSNARPRYIVKADDDVFIHIPNVVRHLASLKESRNYAAGALHLKAGVSRKKTSKFYVPWDIWPRTMYPPYLGGLCYILSADLVDAIFWKSFKVPLFHLEDVYITGVLANETLGVDLDGLPDDVIVEKSPLLKRALQFRNYVWKAIAFHGVNERVMKYLYRVASLHR